MATVKTIRHYAVFHYPSSGDASSRINLYCKDGYRLYILFYDDGAALPDNSFNETYNIGVAYTPSSQYINYIDLIRNDSLRKHITHIYSARYKYVDAKDAEGLQANFDFLYPTLKQHLEYLPGGKARPLDPEAIRQSHVLRSDLLNYRHLVGLSIGAYEMARRVILELIEMIELELD